ncbi:AMP-binding enzyme domain-containing protein [Phthorimaea operculella]|nr:AMP-binding enzyme domain-containing protein [Phthorimaea operculella]
MSSSEIIEMYEDKIKSGRYNIGLMLMDCMKAKDPEGIFQIDAGTGEEETNGSVLSRSIRLARSFRNIGLKPGDVLALGGKNHLDLHIPFYAGTFIGMPIVGVDPYFKYDEIRSLFKITSPKIAFCQQEHADVYARAAEDLGLDVKIVTFDGDNTLAKFIEENDDKNANEKEFQLEEYDTDKVYASLVSTSGTTGMPKVAAFKHDTLMRKILTFVQMQPPIKYDRPPVIFHNSPVQWISSYYNAVIAPIMNNIKLQTSIADKVEHTIDVINKYKPHTVMISPSTMSSILNHKKHCDLTCFNSLTVTGAKCYKELLVAIKLVNPDTGEEITEPNVPGELLARGFSFDRYYNDPEETTKAFTTDGWYKTGDLLYRDKNHNYYFYDRIKMLIKYRNYHINPSELEEVISALEGVLEVSVVGIPHPEDSQRPAACVVRRPGYQITAQEIKDHVAFKLSPSKQLRGGVVFMESLPKTSSGKIARAQLNKLVPTLKRE